MTNEQIIMMIEVLMAELKRRVAESGGIAPRHGGGGGP